MEFTKLLEIVGDEPVFTTGFLLAGHVTVGGVQRQLSRWTSSGRLTQLRRGLYALAPPFRKTKPEPFLVANHLVRASYVSCQSALAFYGLIPEYVPTVTSVTTRRPWVYQTPLGDFIFRHVKKELFWGYQLVSLSGAQQAFVALPEKAILDLVHLTPNADAPEYLQELRLQFLERLDLARLDAFARRTGSPKAQRAAAIVAQLAEREAAEYELL